jgi:CRISPR-associated protein Csm4
MNLYRLHLRPRSPWRTPWQADTLTGALCATAARVHGADFLRQSLIDPMLAGAPPFVLSDAFPGDLLPVPVAVRLAQPPPDADRKAIKRGRWLPRPEFLALRAALPSAAAADGAVPWNRLLPDSAVFHGETTRHNTLARDSDASLEAGGLFSRPDTLLRAARNGDARLTLYFRARDAEATDLLLDLVHELSLTGFGADIATGRGQFDTLSDPAPAADLDQPPADANGVVCLSTFQPAPGDPIDGLWEAFPKFAKLGPDLGLADVRKHTLIMFRPGACFRANPTRAFVGHALPMDDVLPKAAAQMLRVRGIEIVHPAFGLAIPARLRVPKGTPS